MKYSIKEKCLKFTNKEMKECYKNIAKAIYPILENYARMRRESIDWRDGLLGKDEYDYIAWSFKELATSEDSPRNIKESLEKGIIKPWRAKLKFKYYIKEDRAEHILEHLNEMDEEAWASLDKLYNERINFGLYNFFLYFRDMIIE